MIAPRFRSLQLRLAVQLAARAWPLERAAAEKQAVEAEQLSESARSYHDQARETDPGASDSGEDEALAIEAFETRVLVGRHPDDPGRLKSAAVPEEIIAKFKKG